MLLTIHIYNEACILPITVHICDTHAYHRAWILLFIVCTHKARTYHGHHKIHRLCTCDACTYRFLLPVWGLLRLAPIYLTFQGLSTSKCLSQYKFPTIVTVGDNK